MIELMDYNLDSLGTRNFEHLTQALLAKTIGAHLTVFGDGPDGGREASWTGDAPSFGKLPNWDGYGVLQAKFKTQPGDPGANLKWLKSTVHSELAEWAREGTKRPEQPDFLLFVTNVRLSSVPDNGKDEAVRALAGIASKLGIRAREIGLWDYYDISARLDDAADIRKRYSAFVTPGDVINALLDQLGDDRVVLGEALAAYTARSLIDESLLNLTQAGTSGDNRVTIADVFVDLPSEIQLRDSLNIIDFDISDYDTSFSDDVTEEVEAEYEPEEYDDIDDDDYPKRISIADYLIDDFNQIGNPERAGQRQPHRTVLIGGPGQGKSTITQWLAEIYRAEFLRGSPVTSTSELSDLITKLEKRRQDLKLPEIRGRRWPFRIVLTELADHLASNPGHSLLHYIAARVSDRSSVPVDTMMMRRWLATYSWLLLIDGLDEVPVSSNRDQVMTAIRDFFLDVATIGADVAAVATTRPQGYGEEFSRSEYRHLHLSTLQIDEALNYAGALVALRMGDGTDSAKKVMDRLRRASREEHTSRLFESPLQVTILEVLLEKLGKAPSDRSRLYSAYYSVISQREQEKSGELSDLLQRYESDVDYLHRKIGFELQTRGAEVGETTSSISIDEFHALIVEWFTTQGHSVEEVATLVNDFAVLVTDRLVFLAKLQSDRIGFELRSLQEFMAGEYLVNLKESEVIRAIENRAVIPYWRNVVLFAIGSIFANRQHLRAEVVVLCDHLNDASRLSTVLRPGSELALEILRDGSCLSIPRYASPLAKNAISLLTVPAGVNVLVLRFLSTTDFAELLWEELEAAQAASRSQWLNRATLLSALREADGDRADIALRRLFDTADADLKLELITLAWDRFDRGIAEIIGDRFLLASPRVFDTDRKYSIRNKLRGPTARQPEWVRHLGDLAAVRYQDRPDYEHPNSGRMALTAFYYQLGTNVPAWEWLAQQEAPTPEWRSQIAVAEFASDPSAQTLALALDALAEVDESPTIFSATPWPVMACVRHASKTRGDEKTAQPDALRELANAARNGDLGDREEWLATQERWGPVIAVDTAFLDGVVTSANQAPTWAGLAGDQFPPNVFNFTARSPSNERETSDAAHMIHALTSRADRVPYAAEIAPFIGSVLGRLATLNLMSKAVRKDLFTELSRLIKADVPDPQWLPWVNLLPDTLTPTKALIQILGSRREYVRYLDEEHALQVFAKAGDKKIGTEAFRLALYSSPGLVVRVDVDTVKAHRLARPELSFGILEAAVKLSTSEPEALWSGELDDDLTEVASTTDRVFNMDWFIQLLNAEVLPMSNEIAARGAVVLADNAPTAAEQLWDWAARGVQ